ncbi:asparagine synthase-related protein [Deinococcus koreensis]|uniref:asparagine synthase (glutamine-hydrolyzing) n=1 Tax=Deinococcus koreensis TaxID=2054903 RepID=A0A2K3UVK2_9DEIO|nr:asparagine synthase-related protein [Deinococcus koreensis]PNY80564.1 hypothetical protein CVO96_03565 [Deinococcus koreensis]
MSADFALRLDWVGTAADRGQGCPDDLGLPFRVGGWAVRFTQGLRAPEGSGPVVCRESGVVAILSGHLYGTAPRQLPQLYRQHGAQLAGQLEGAFVLVLLDLRSGRVLAITDRVGSHKLYVAQELAQGEGRVDLATRVDWPAFRRRPLDPAGVAGYLATGNMFNGLSLYQGVRSLDRATVHELTPDGLMRQDYWTLTPEPSAGRASLPDLRAELAALLRRAVERRLPAPGAPATISLSGGYDSRGLLSLLSGRGHGLETFSYSLGTPARGSDPTVAQRLAAQYGARHQVLTAYRGDLLSTVRRNARWGQGVTHFCDEADAWAELSEHLGGRSPGDIFVGEQAFELSAKPLNTVPEQLKNHHLTGFYPLNWLAGRLPDGAFGHLENAWQGELETIVARTLHWESPLQRELALTLDQSLPYVLLPWRERFAGHAARVHTPYLDTDVLEFLQRVPLEALADKALFKDALRHLDSELLRVPIASSMGYEPDWAAELRGQREAVWEAMRAQPSRLDDLIDPDAVRSLLSGLSAPSLRARLTGAARQHLGRFRHGPYGTRLFGPAGLRIPSVDVPTFLMRLLTLREAEMRSPALAGLDTWTPEMERPALSAPPASLPPHAAS